MIRRAALAVAAAAVIAFVLLWALTIPEVVPASALPPHTPDLDNGKVMFDIGGCASCHATPNADSAKVVRTQLGGGLALQSPFGTFYVPNISPDLADGIGAWSEADFVTAMWKGTSPRGRHLFPAFPYPSYQHMELDDVRDLFAYLKTLPPVSGRVRRHDLAFPFNVRRLVGLWKLLCSSTAGRSRLIPRQSAQAQSRRLPGERARALRRVPQPAQFSRRHHRQRAFRRRPGGGRQGLGAQHHARRIAAFGRGQRGVVAKGRGELSWRWL